MKASTALRMAVGPLAVAGFFMSWGSGAGPFAAVEFSGYRLVAFTGALDVLVEGVLPTAILLIVRMAILAVVVAAVWHSLLAPTLRWHPLYAISGWYISAWGLFLLILAALRGDLGHPSSGALLMAAAATLFVCAELAPKVWAASFSNFVNPTSQGAVG